MRERYSYLRREDYTYYKAFNKKRTFYKKQENNMIKNTSDRKITSMSVLIFVFIFIFITKFSKKTIQDDNLNKKEEDSD